ncbi:MAG: metallophosphoesterase [Kiritimatiellae bacterium]|nr:metallophosphoesterase [Kiritimatiellia bacterium]
MEKGKPMGMISRRWFIGGMAGAAFGARRLFAEAGAASASGAKVKFGVLSDVHLKKTGDEAAFLKALAYFRENNVDGVLIAGDIADTGCAAQLKLCADCWYKTFPDGKAPDGRPVEQLFVYGNHDIDGWKWKANAERYKKDPELRKVDAIGFENNRARVWEGLFHEKYAPIWMKRVKGYTFIGAHWSNIQIEAFMKAHGKEIDPSLPFFYTQHAHPRNTCFGGWAWGRDDGRSTRALSPFSNAVAFSGHSHYTLTDERTVWQGAFTSINTASLKYASTDYALRENMPGNGHGYRGEKRKHLMPSIPTSNGKQGMLVSVFGDRIAIERREFVTGKSLGDDWVLPLPCAESKPFAYAARVKTRTAPEFAAGAEVKAVTTKDEKKGDLIEITFPAAKTSGKCRVFEYEVTAVLTEDDVELVQLQRRVLAPDFHLPETKEGMAGRCVLAAADLPMKGRYRFEVRPLECFGRKGAPISVEATV